MASRFNVCITRDDGPGFGRERGTSYELRAEVRGGQRTCRMSLELKDPTTSCLFAKTRRVAPASLCRRCKHQHRWMVSLRRGTRHSRLQQADPQAPSGSPPSASCLLSRRPRRPRPSAQSSSSSKVEGSSAPPHPLRRREIARVRREMLVHDGRTRRHQYAQTLSVKLRCQEKLQELVQSSW